MLRYAQLDVFTSTPFLGNPLAIVHLPSTASLSQSQKQNIAREFNLTETVFLHEPSSDGTVTIDIFTTTEEIPFAGHPTIGTGSYLFSQPIHASKDTIVLKTKAGDIPVLRSRPPTTSTDNRGTRVTLQVPVDFKIHPPFSDTRIVSLQSLVQPGDFYLTPGSFPVASIVKGMTFVLLQVTSSDALGRLHTYPAHFEGTKELLGEWEGLLIVYAYLVESEEDHVVKLRTRMFHGPLEDPATGSAASALSAYLASKKGEGRWGFEIVQGVEMGRRSEIGVEVEVGEGGSVKRVVLGGEAVEVLQGQMSV